MDCAYAPTKDFIGCVSQIEKVSRLGVVELKGEEIK